MNRSGSARALIARAPLRRFPRKGDLMKEREQRSYRRGMGRALSVVVVAVIAAQGILATLTMRFGDGPPRSQRVGTRYSPR